MRKAIFLLPLWLGLMLAPAWASTMNSIGKDRVKVHSRPDAKSPVVFQAGLGYPIEIERRQNNWVYCRDWKKKAGWVYQPLVSNIQTAVITVANAKVRKGPGSRQPVVLQASRGEIFRVFGAKGPWVKIGYYLENEPVGWVRHDLVWGD